jgi:hypothetical protein
MYGILMMYILWQLFILYQSKHKLLHYKSIFNLLALFWMLLRTIFWGMFVGDISVDPTLYSIIFLIPQAILFFTFSTLALFLLKHINKKNWSSKIKLLWMAVYLIIGIVDIISTVGLAIAIDLTADDDVISEYNNTEIMVNAILFLILSAGFIYIGFKLKNILDWNFKHMFALSPKRTSFVVWLLAASFASRSIINFITFAGLFSVDIDRYDISTDLEAFFFYVIWEFLPLCLLLVTIATRPQKNFAERDIELLNHGVFSAIEKMNVSDDSRTPLIPNEEEKEATGNGFFTWLHDEDDNGLGMGGGLLMVN